MEVVGEGEGELAHQPAVGELVILDDGVAVIVGLAYPSETGPERVAVDGAV